MSLSLLVKDKGINWNSCLSFIVLLSPTGTCHCANAPSLKFPFVFYYHDKSSSDICTYNLILLVSLESWDIFPLDTWRQEYAMTDECFISTVQFMLTSKTCYACDGWNGTNNKNIYHKCRDTPGTVNIPGDKAFPWPELLTILLKSKISSTSFLVECFALYPIWKQLSLEWSTLDAALPWYSLLTSGTREMEQHSQWSSLWLCHQVPHLSPHFSLVCWLSRTCLSLCALEVLTASAWPPCVLGWFAPTSEVGSCPSNKRRLRTDPGICFSPNTWNFASFTFAGVSAIVSVSPTVLWTWLLILSHCFCSFDFTKQFSLFFPI